MLSSLVNVVLQSPSGSVDIFSKPQSHSYRTRARGCEGGGRGRGRGGEREGRFDKESSPGNAPNCQFIVGRGALRAACLFHVFVRASSTERTFSDAWAVGTRAMLAETACQFRERRFDRSWLQREERRELIPSLSSILLCRSPCVAVRPLSIAHFHSHNTGEKYKISSCSAEYSPEEYRI